MRVLGPMQACYANKYYGVVKYLHYSRRELSLKLMLPGRGAQQPIVLHANGHDKTALQHRSLLPMTNASEFHTPTEAMLNHPVLLLDERTGTVAKPHKGNTPSAMGAAAAHGVVKDKAQVIVTAHSLRRSVCRVTTLGDLLNNHLRSSHHQ
mmetsp:Transcript_37434/g.74836  ORF Transcript_37434/g.74836 Transcript_37434/m.74836 type:complete len:151 (-) Transcript_37434:178-630(-)|eukprot:CAMPEP_0174756172 /NCGR_PEP_ID=MMETSP1094-20130205/106625_1 /TAXON_ID=156173 /ORGANISM="Chrysochromulina brevifilum, Strain UTEX LB 985" /LENGTH=150 /DNA_ID=CAMNT_0015962079 /DNA_START=890 /DNA_END=1342 /DNA_ORIENTATION=-